MSKKILVTGGCGFIGSNLVDILVKDSNNNVFVVDNLDTGKREYCNEKATYIFKDIREIFSEEIPKNLKDVEVIFHLAALARIQPSFEKPVDTFDINTQGTALVCEYAHKIGAKVVYAGSSSYYGGVYLNPYAFSKWQGEEVCRMYSQVYGLDTSVARFFNVYGSRHPKSGPYATVVGVFERQYKNKEPLTITGNGEQRRDFTHVGDICTGLIALSEKQFKGEPFNLGTGKNHSMNELSVLFTGSGKKYIPARPGEAWITLADIEETTSSTGWLPKMKLEDYIFSWISKNE